MIDLRLTSKCNKSFKIFIMHHVSCFIGCPKNQYGHSWLRNYTIKFFLRWKKYLTKLQLFQFFICLFSCVTSLYVDCDFPKWMHYALLFYAMSLIALFLNFYIHAYIKGSIKGSIGFKTSNESRKKLKLTSGVENYQLILQAKNLTL